MIGRRPAARERGGTRRAARVGAMEHQPEDGRAAAAALLDAFAERTGLASSRPARRYLWTDAFAVCTWLGLHRATGEARHRELALALVEEVHRVLGRHRDDDPRDGWISGLEEEEGARHPTAGGLRIGKPLPERGPEEPYDPDLEWDRDGQYYHYLTKWMHALDRVARATREPRYHRWAAELARAAHRGFAHGAHGADGAPRLYWKVSIDLSRPLVPSMGHHDPLDGLVAAETLRASPVADPGAPDLSGEVAGLERLCAGRSWATDDALGVGGLLTDALLLGRLVAAGHGRRRALLGRVLLDAAESLAVLVRRNPLGLPPERRLAFRELGLSLGLHAAWRLREEGAAAGTGRAAEAALATLADAAPLGEAIERSWMAPEARAAPPWTDHEDINAVTLAASLAPEGWLDA